MCGIIGLYKKDLSSNLINRMNDMISHRGPDDEGYISYDLNERSVEHFSSKDSVVKFRDINTKEYFHNSVVLGHRRLSILDISAAGHQPMQYQDSDFYIVHNGEVYNYIEIRAELLQKGYSFKTKTDTEVILAAYNEWGEECVNRFNGMWAFCILDKKREHLFISRDRTGVKPLYYIYNNESGEFVFASEIKPLLTYTNNAEVNHQISYDFLHHGKLEHTNETFFNKIMKLEQGHNLVYSLKNFKLNIKKYFNMEYNQKLGTFSQEQFDQYKINVKEKLQKAINIRLRSDVSIGSSLSGGIDSSAIVGISGDLYSKSNLNIDYKTYTITFEGSDIDESILAKEVSSNAGFEWINTTPSKEELWNDFNDLIYTQEEPFGSSSIYAQYRVMKLANKHGTKVLLDGQGADELFAGYYYFLNTLNIQLLKNLRLNSLYKELNLSNNSMKINILKLVNSMAKSFHINLSREKLQNNLLNNKFEDNYKTKNIVNFDNLNEQLAYYMGGGPLQKLLKYEDKNSMRWSIESRTPFADDIELIEYVNSIPATFKLHNGINKTLLRETVKNDIPYSVYSKKEKIGFETPGKEWLSSSLNEIKNLAEEIGDNEVINTAYIKDNLNDIISFQRKNKGDFWKVLNYMAWYKLYILNKV